ncbi:MAG: DNA ligase, partial [Desulfatitalea sp.]|nr:DNA ligase [Desulfatitalea sp.]
VQKLVAAGYDTLEKIYAMTGEDFEVIGFGPVQSHNLFQALGQSREKPVEDWRFLAALGVPDLGVGDSRKLLQHAGLASLNQLDAQQISAIDGFGEITSQSVVQGLAEVKATLDHLLTLGFNLAHTPLASDANQTDSPLSGKCIVFTGKMARGSRDDMAAVARRLGANVQSTVSRKTDYLVCGEKVGPSKLDKARRLGIRILSEAEFDQLVGGPPPAQMPRNDQSGEREGVP